MIKPKPRNRDGAILTESINTDNALIYTVFQDKDVAFYLRAGKLLSVFTKGEGLPVGTVCLGKISEIKSDINACFLLLKDKQKAFMQLSEAESAAPPSKSDHIKCGDNLLVEITKEPAKGKLATAKAFSGDESIIREAKSRTDYSVLKEGEDYIDKSVRFALSAAESYGDKGEIRVLTDRQELVETLKARTEAANTATSAVTPDNYAQFSLGVPKLYEDALVSLKVLYGLESKVKEALGRKVWLDSGAYITIENTEAMTVIDVNSAKSSAKKSEDDHYYTVNAEAADEIVRQIILRNLSGIIVVDFINMKNKDRQNDIIDRIRNHPLNYDKTMNICGFTRLGLLELTRRKTRHPLTEVFTL